MKKLFILSAAAILTAGALQAQNQEVAIRSNEKMLNKQEKTLHKEKKEDRKELRALKGKEVSYEAREQFYRDFGDITAAWKRESFFDVATFNKDGQQQSAFYDADAQLVGVTMHKSFADLPVKTKSLILSKYKDYTVADVILFDDNEQNDSDMILYGTQFEDADNYFIELVKADKKIILKSTLDGGVSFFTSL